MRSHDPRGGELRDPDSYASADSRPLERTAGSVPSPSALRNSAASIGTLSAFSASVTRDDTAPPCPDDILPGRGWSDVQRSSRSPWDDPVESKLVPRTAIEDFLDRQARRCRPAPSREEFLAERRPTEVDWRRFARVTAVGPDQVLLGESLLLQRDALEDLSELDTDAVSAVQGSTTRSMVQGQAQGELERTTVERAVQSAARRGKTEEDGEKRPSARRVRRPRPQLE